MSPPMIRADEFPEAEQSVVFNISNNLYRLVHAVEELDHAVELVWFGHTQSREHIEKTREQRSEMAAREHIDWTVRDAHRKDARVFDSWVNIGGRHSALILHGFNRTMQITNGLLGQCPELKSKIDLKLKKRAEQLFQKSFSQVGKLRKNVAHPGEFGTTNAKFVADAHTGELSLPGLQFGDGATGLLDDVMLGDEYTCTIEGEVVSLKVNKETVATLANVCAAYFGAFRPVS